MSDSRRNSSPRQQERRLLVSGHLKTALVPQDCQNSHSSLQSPSYKAQVTTVETKTPMSWGPRQNEATNCIRGDLRPPRAWKRRRTNPPPTLMIKPSLKTVLCLLQPDNSPSKKTLIQLAAAVRLALDLRLPKDPTPNLRCQQDAWVSVQTEFGEWVLL